jgi:anti-sigma-K factor RskA
MTMRVRSRRHDPERNAAEYVSGDLSARARRWFEQHMLDCEDCWREVVLGRIGRRAAEDAREPVPMGLRDRVRAKIQMSSADDDVDR